jgi:hypothetical protein
MSNSGSVTLWIAQLQAGAARAAGLAVSERTVERNLAVLRKRQEGKDQR